MNFCAPFMKWFILLPFRKSGLNFRPYSGSCQPEIFIWVDDSTKLMFVLAILNYKTFVSLT